MCFLKNILKVTTNSYCACKKISKFAKKKYNSTNCEHIQYGNIQKIQDWPTSLPLLPSVENYLYKRKFYKGTQMKITREWKSTFTLYIVYCPHEPPFLYF